MKILILSDRYIPDTTGTALRISRQLKPIVDSKSDIEIHVATLKLFSSLNLLNSGTIPRHEKKDGIFIHRFSNELLLLLYLPILMLRNKFHLVHGRGIRLGLYAILFAIFSRIPCVTELNSINIQKGWIKSFLWKKVLFKSKRLIVLTKYAKEWIHKEFGISKEKIDIVINGVDLDMFTVNHDSRKMELGLKNSPIIGYAGSFLEWQGVFEFVKVAAFVNSKISNARFLMVGDGPSFGKTKQLTEYYGIKGRFIFTGRVKPHEVPRYIQTMDVFLLARPIKYKKNDIASPLKLFEAMAMKKAIVVTPVQGLIEIVENMKTGLIAGPDINKIGEAVIKLIRDKKLRNELGKSARKRVEDLYSWNFSAECLFRSYLKAMDSGI